MRFICRFIANYKEKNVHTFHSQSVNFEVEYELFRHEWHSPYTPIQCCWTYGQLKLIFWVNLLENPKKFSENVQSLMNNTRRDIKYCYPFRFIWNSSWIMSWNYDGIYFLIKSTETHSKCDKMYDLIMNYHCSNRVNFKRCLCTIRWFLTYQSIVVY